MITEKQWLAFSPKRRREKLPFYTIIPKNRLGIEPGYYTNDDLIVMLRRRKADAAVVQFILDMLE